MERELDDRIRYVSWTVEMHTTQLDSIGEMLDDMERGGEIADRNLYHRLDVLEDQMRELRDQVRELMRWEPWLLRVYRWWYGIVTPG
jgi:DNA-binding transcriptional MerR regulator